MRTTEKMVLRNFTQLLETIANGKNRVLDFGDGLVFYRGEIHIIKIIGECPGIFQSEIARCFHVTRAVVSKSMLKLEQHGYVRKEVDEKDKKRVKVYLTDRGWQAFQAHEEFHRTHDKYIYEYLESLDEAELEAIRGFLHKSCQWVGNHF